MMAMETSSPLAALQPSRLSHHWGHHGNAAEFDDGFLRPCRPAKEFNFNHMSMQKSNSDYFSFRPARGSSPTQSLAVDLSQNFHIDKSPQLPTPRRSLFTTTSIRERHHGAVTPPIQSSSPAPQDERMECSPLPHKAPQSAVQEVPPAAPTPDEPPIADSISKPVGGLRRSDSQPENILPVKPLEERKPFIPGRPSMRRGLTSSNVPTRRPRTSDSSKPFWFGPVPTMAKPSLESCAESPPSERKLVPSTSNPSLTDTSTTVPFNGSPIACPQPRRPGMPRQRSGMNRRTLSVQYDNSSRAMRAEKRCCTTGSIQPALYQDDYSLKLPHFKPRDDDEGLPRISKDTFLDVLDGKFSSDVGDVEVIDCRFEYEFHGGHINGAINLNDKEEMAQKLFEPTAGGSKALVFHCQYSVHRAPMMAKHVRQRDRTVNQDVYPRLTYPEVYILDGGYHSFHETHGERCGGYVKMEDEKHENACERGMGKLKQRAKLSRAQTYAFGQNSSSTFHDSPVPTLPSGFPNSAAVDELRPSDMMDVDPSSPMGMGMGTDSPLAAAFTRQVRRFDTC